MSPNTNVKHSLSVIIDMRRANDVDRDETRPFTPTRESERERERESDHHLAVRVFLIIADVYNLLSIHGIATQRDFPKSVLDLNQFGKITAYQIGEHVYSLDDILHGILRGNPSGVVTCCSTCSLTTNR
jgi:hypothetical protein